MSLSYFIGQKRAPIPYDLKSIGKYTLLTVGLLGVYYGLRIWVVSNTWVMMGIGTVLIGIYCVVLTRKDFPLSGLPVVGKYFKK
jgi:hypothetical protein